MKKAAGDITNYEKAVIRKQELRDDIENISRHATWMLGILTLLIIALASFIFKDLEIELEAGNKLTWVMWYTAVMTCIIYFFLLLYYIYRLISPNFDESDEELLEYADIWKKIKWEAARLRTLTKQFRTLLYLFIASAPTAFFYALTLWYSVT